MPRSQGRSLPYRSQRVQIPRQGNVNAYSITESHHYVHRQYIKRDRERTLTKRGGVEKIRWKWYAAHRPIDQHQAIYGLGHAPQAAAPKHDGDLGRYLVIDRLRQPRRDLPAPMSVTFWRAGSNCGRRVRLLAARYIDRAWVRQSGSSSVLPIS